MTILEWVMAYLLIGFMVYWTGVAVFKYQSTAAWWSELLEVVAWPVVVGGMVFIVVREKLQRRKATGWMKAGEERIKELRKEARRGGDEVS